jgi:hypothetical protein
LWKGILGASFLKYVRAFPCTHCIWKALYKSGNAVCILNACYLQFYGIMKFACGVSHNNCIHGEYNGICVARHYNFWYVLRLVYYTFPDDIVLPGKVQRTSIKI